MSPMWDLPRPIVVINILYRGLIAVVRYCEYTYNILNTISYFQKLGHLWPSSSHMTKYLIASTVNLFIKANCAALV